MPIQNMTQLPLAMPNRPRMPVTRPRAQVRAAIEPSNGHGLGLMMW
jgi:hypothetical protein